MRPGGALRRQAPKLTWQLGVLGIPPGSRNPTRRVRTRCRVAAPFTALVPVEHPNERIEQVFARGGKIVVAASAIDLAAPMTGSE